MDNAELIVNACPENADNVLGFVESELDWHNFPAHLQPDILVAVEEVFVNIAHYAYPDGEEGDVALSVFVGEEAVIRFEDRGRPYNPLERESPDLSVPLMEREIGRLGIHFVKELMDKAEYKYIGGKNTLIITKSTTTCHSERSEESRE